MPSILLYIEEVGKHEKQKTISDNYKLVDYGTFGGDVTVLYSYYGAVLKEPIFFHGDPLTLIP
jgi:hypothetical protein